MGVIFSKEYPEPYYPGVRPYPRRPHHPHIREHYVKDSFNVYWRGRQVDGADVMSFQDLGHGYGKDSFNVYYRGRKMDASIINFSVQSNGYAKDAFNTYYKGNKISMLAFSASGKSKKKKSKLKYRKISGKVY